MLNLVFELGNDFGQDFALKIPLLLDRPLDRLRNAGIDLGERRYRYIAPATLRRWLWHLLALTLPFPIFGRKRWNPELRIDRITVQHCSDLHRNQLIHAYDTPGVAHPAATHQARYQDESRAPQQSAW
jgi:hypothetical protein